MKTLIIAAAVLFATVAPALGQTSGWVKLSSTEGHFSVLMPGTAPPTEKNETTQSDHGPYTTHLYVQKGDDGVFLVGWVDYDPTFNFNRQAELDSNRDNFLKGISAKLISTRSTTFDGYNAVEFVCETDTMVFRSRVYMVGRRPYQLVIGTAKGVDSTAKADKFFSSFKVSPT